MKTVLWSTAWLEGKDPLGSDRVDRTKRFLDYNRKIKKELGFDQIILNDNCSHWSRINQLGATPFHERGLPHQRDCDFFLYRHSKPLTRSAGHNDYPYVWRGVYFLEKIIDLGDVDKIIVCADDCFVLTERLAHYIRDSKSGIVSFPSKVYDFPLTELSIINRDAFPILKKWFQVPWWVRSESRALYESAFPITHLEKRFTGDRYGEFFVRDHPVLYVSDPDRNARGWPQDETMDFYAQARLDVPMIFERYRK